MSGIAAACGVLLAVAALGCDTGHDREEAVDPAEQSVESPADDPTDADPAPTLPPRTRAGRDCTDDAATELFDRRIAPLLADDRPSSCNRCHLSGIDLAHYVRDDACSTMVCMHAEGLVDFDEPADSLVLDWISRAAPQSPGITESVVAQEHAAMLEWIDFYADCGSELCEVDVDADPEQACGQAPTHNDCEGPETIDTTQPYDDPGGCEPRVLEEMFSAKVYAWRGRCGPCHYASTPSHIEAPRWVDVGACDIGSLQSMRNVVESGYLDPVDPAQSLLLRKPLSEELGGVPHGGHSKIHALDDPAYVDMLAWIERWADCHNR